MIRLARNVALAAMALLCMRVGAAAAPPDLSGLWLPVPELATPWPESMPFTEAARTRLAGFDPDRDEPAGFCMPLGTPRNTLAMTGPLEVLQTADRVYFVRQPDLLNAETRRVYLDGRPRPPEVDRIPTWLGASRGKWEGDALIVETTDLEPQAILDWKGYSHSGALVVREKWTLRQDSRHGRLLVNEMKLEDPESFTQPVQLTRVFVAAPQAQMVDGRCSERLWIDTLWRHRLKEHADARRAPRSGGGSAGARP